VKILDNLKELHEIFKVTRENISFTPTKLSTIIKHIDRVETENAVLKAKVARLSAAVSEKEWRDTYDPKWRTQEGQDRCNSLIARRAERQG